MQDPIFPTLTATKIAIWSRVMNFQGTTSYKSVIVWSTRVYNVMAADCHGTDASQ